MKRISIDITRYHSEVYYTASVYDVENPVNFHSYDCVYRKSDHDLKELIRDLVRNGFSEEVEQLVGIFQDCLEYVD